jgi:hypothetical protein
VTDASGSVARQQKITHAHESPFYHYAQFPLLFWIELVQSLTDFEKWSEILESVQSEYISLKKTQLIYVSSFLRIPGTNASTERVLSITNALWTDKNNHFLVEV